MSYTLISIPKENFLRVVTDSNPLYVPLGALSAADATVLTVAVTVGAFSGTSATMTFEESYDGGTDWTTVSSTTADLINNTGEFKIKLNPDNGPLSPNVRLKIECSAGSQLYLSTVYRTFIQSNVMVPRDITVSSDTATETTLIQILGQVSTIESEVDGLETLITSTNTKLDTLHTDIGTTVVGYIDGLETLVTSTNTKLDTLHTDIGTTIAGYVDGLETTINNISGYVDGLETLVTSTNTKLDTIHTDIGTTIAGYVDGIETLVTSTNTKLDTLHTDVGTTIAGYVDGIETLVTSTNTKLDTLHTDVATTIAGYVDGIETALGKIRAWPYATYAKIIQTSDATYKYYTYKTSGDATVGTITETIATGDVTFSPDKAV